MKPFVLALFASICCAACGTKGPLELPPRGSTNAPASVPDHNKDTPGTSPDDTRPKRP